MRLLSATLLFLFAACKESIVHDLSESEANRILTRLHEISITGEKVHQPDGLWSLSVDKTNVMPAIKWLNDSRLIKNDKTKASDKSSLLSSREDQRFRSERSLSNALETTLSSIQGVLESRVHLNLPATDPILGHRLANTKGSGSVLLVVTSDFVQSNEAVAKLVASAAGLVSSEISVLVSREEKMNPNLGSRATSDSLSIEEIKPPSLITEQGLQWWNITKYIDNLELWITGILLFVSGILVLIIGKKGRLTSNASIEIEEAETYDFKRDLQ